MTGRVENPVWSLPEVALYQGDAARVVRSLPTGSVDCVVTSPPYWGLRDYGVRGQYGTESTVEEYVRSLVGVFGEIVRVLRSDGVVWLNLGDTYGGSWGNYVAAGSRARIASARAGWRQGRLRPPQSATRRKDLQGVPWRVAFALVDNGWFLRESIVWVKPNARPESARDRFAQRYEMLFCLTRRAVSTLSLKVWTLPAARSSFGHIAVGSLALAQRCIRISCPAGGVVLDPFCGSGTTGIAARAVGCSFLGIDLDPASLAIARRRLIESE